MPVLVEAKPCSLKMVSGPYVTVSPGKPSRVRVVGPYMRLYPFEMEISPPGGPSRSFDTVSWNLYVTELDALLRAEVVVTPSTVSARLTQERVPIDGLNWGNVTVVEAALVVGKLT